MIQEHIDLLNVQKVDIQTSFNRFKNIRPFLGVYKRSATSVFLTFGFVSNFAPTLKVGRNIMQLVTTFDASLDFETQFQASLLS